MVPSVGPAFASLRKAGCELKYSSFAFRQIYSFSAFFSSLLQSREPRPRAKLSPHSPDETRSHNHHLPKNHRPLTTTTIIFSLPVPNRPYSHFPTAIRSACVFLPFQFRESCIASHLHVKLRTVRALPTQSCVAHRQSHSPLFSFPARIPISTPQQAARSSTLFAQVLVPAS